MPHPDGKATKKLNKWAGKKFKKTGKQPTKIEAERKKAKIGKKLSKKKKPTFSAWEAARAAKSEAGRASNVAKQRSTGHSETHSGGNPSARSIYGPEE